MTALTDLNTKAEAYPHHVSCRNLQRPGWAYVSFFEEPALVSGLKEEPALDVLAGWLASRIDGPVQRAVGTLKVELVRHTETVTLSRPQNGSTATLSRTGRPDALLPLARRETRDCLAEDLRRLDPDEIYHEALQGIDKVSYA